MLGKNLRRIVLIIPTVLLISLLAFSMLYYAPGDTAALALRARTGLATLTEAQTEVFAAEKGLDAGFVKLYGSWLGGVLRGDLGTSYVDGENVTPRVLSAMGRTLCMALVAWAVYVVLGTASGMMAAVSSSRVWDKLAKYWSVFSTAIPVFWISLFIVWVLSVKLGILSTVGKRSGFSLILPGVLMGLVYTGNLIVIIKEKTCLILEEPFILHARAMGRRKGDIMRSHVVKNILAPAIATSALAFSGFVGSSILMENIFSISGFGTLLTSAIQVKDYMVVASGTLVMGVLVCIANLLADVAHSFIDRRTDAREASQYEKT